MIEYISESDFVLEGQNKYTDWINDRVSEDGKTAGSVNFIFCTDPYLLDMNQKYLQHDYYTDIITFSYSEGLELVGDVFISIDRVRENAVLLKTDFKQELARVMIHGILHLLGWKDDTDTAKANMRAEEDRCLKMFHVKQ